MAVLINTKSILFISFIFFISLLLAGCTKEQTENLTIASLNIDEELVPYFERFVTEGKSRGIEIDLVQKQIEGFLINISESDVAGQCTYSDNSTREVNIDIAYWNKATELEKEFVVFHELGHCYLERSHLDTRENRNCTSMMHSGTSGCRFRYTTTTRSAYLDELF